MEKFKRFKSFDDGLIQTTVFGYSNGSGFRETRLIKSDSLEIFLKTVNRCFDVVVLDNNHKKVYSGCGKRV